MKKIKVDDLEYKINCMFDDLLDYKIRLSQYQDRILRLENIKEFLLKYNKDEILIDYAPLPFKDRLDNDNNTYTISYIWGGELETIDTAIFRDIEKIKKLEIINNKEIIIITNKNKYLFNKNSGSTTNVDSVYKNIKNKKSKTIKTTKRSK